MSKPVSKAKLEAFENKVYKLAKEMFETDDDGDLPVSWMIIDRSRYEPVHFFALPYWHKARTEEERDHILDLCATNVEIASKKLENLFRRRKMDREHRENDFQPTMKERVEALEQEREEALAAERAAKANNAPLRGALRDALDLAILSSSDKIHHACLAGDADCAGKECKKFRQEWKKLRDVYGKNMSVRALDQLLNRENVRVP